mmetsp:Transcript_21906/g.62118  ORF Transcript_21906/g.62118 Transcript_21906/m.62118 type:complete len:228 (+) Transcript_21906:611-1294(+)
MPGAQRPAEHHLGPRGLASEAAPGNHWRNERRLGEVAKTRAPDVDLIGREDLRKQARLQGSREVLGRGRAPHVHVDVQAEVQRGHRDETPAASLQRSLELERGPAPPRLCRQRLLSEELVLCHARPLQVAVQAEDEIGGSRGRRLLPRRTVASHRTQGAERGHRGHHRAHVRSVVHLLRRLPHFRRGRLHCVGLRRYLDRRVRDVFGAQHRAIDIRQEAENHRETDK